MGKTEVLAEVMLWLMGAGLAAAMGAVVWSAVLATRTRVRSGRIRENIASHRVAWGLAVGTPLLLLLTFLLASPASLLINGKLYSDTFWLRVADMFIVSTAVLFVVALAALVVGKIKG